jgi:hypothetical protein
LSALSFAAMASPGSWKVAWVAAFVDLGGGGGVGKDMDMGRGLEWGMFAGAPRSVDCEDPARGAMLGRTEERLMEVVRLMAVVVDGSGREGGAMDLRTTEDWRPRVDCLTEGLRAGLVVSVWEDADAGFFAAGEAEAFFSLC